MLSLTFAYTALHVTGRGHQVYNDHHELVTKEGSMAKTTSINVAEAKRHLADLLGRVAYGGETITITRRGKPMARLVPIDMEATAPHVADVQGWLEDDDAFFATMDAIVADRETHLPRTLRQTDLDEHVPA
jgi:prevent-host-death family protein